MPTNRKVILFAGLFLASSAPAFALNVDWNGYFRGDNNFVHNYQHDMSTPGYSDKGGSGEYVPGQGQKAATFSSFFLKLKPRILVNDNVIIRSEWNVGDPVAGFFGRGVPRTDINDPLSTRKGDLNLSVSRLWLDAHTDFGTLQVGRAPMNWGLGVIFHSGDGPWDRYQSTMDTIRLNSKFGYLSLIPIYAKMSMGRNLAGSQTTPSATSTTTGLGATMDGSDDITDYGIGLKYDNPEEELEGGILYYKRNANDQQTNIYFPGGATAYSAGANGMNLKLFDLYGRKVWKRFELKGELPIYTGHIGDVNGVGERNTYSATGVAIEAGLNYDTWKHLVKVGQAPGQGPTDTGSRGAQFGALYFNRNYKLGNILFNYNLSGFGPANADPIYPSTSSPTTVSSPYDAAIVNARYAMISTEKMGEQWGWNAGFVWAQARESALAGKDYYNHRTRTWSKANTDQGKGLGWELDFGLRYRWDESITFGSDLGMFFPGDYYAFTNNAAITSKTDRVSALSFTVGTVF